jgi:hypothetical protein
MITLPDSWLFVSNDLGEMKVEWSAHSAACTGGTRAFRIDKRDRQCHQVSLP